MTTVHTNWATYNFHPGVGGGINQHKPKAKRAAKQARCRENGINRADLHRQKSGQGMMKRLEVQGAIDAISNHA